MRLAHIEYFAMSLEADVAYLHLIDGIRQPDVPPGFAVRAAPRRCARGRDRDLLLLGLYLDSAPPSIIDLTAEVFFGTPGSITAALRATVVAVNNKLLELNRLAPDSNNRGLATTGASLSGGLTCAVLRENELYVAQSGPGQIVIVHPRAVERFPETSREAQLLGLGGSPDVQYFHTNVAPADYVLLTRKAPEGWESKSIATLSNTGLESAIARLTRLAGKEAAAMIARLATEGAAPVKTRPAAISAAPVTTAARGTPPLRVELPPTAGLSTAETEANEAEAVAETEAAMIASPAESLKSSLAGIISRVRASPAMGEPEFDQPTGVELAERASENLLGAAEATKFAPAEPAVRTQSEANPQALGGPELEADDEEPESRFNPREWLAASGERLKNWFLNLPLRRAEASLKRGSSSLGGSLSGAGGNLVRRVLPEGADLYISNSTFLAVAILVPIIIALVVATIYIQRGRNTEFSNYLTAAKLEAAQARTKANPLEAKPHWINTLNLLSEAETILPGQAEAATLRAEARAAVDAVESIQRLNFEPLVPGGFGQNADLTEIVVNGNEVYTLDGAQKQVYRIVLTEADKYTIDRGFKCGAGPVGTYNISQIVDIAWLNTPNIVNKPALLAMDADGDLMYCKPDGSAPEASQLTPPDTGWRSPKAVEIFADRLYVFDPGANEIWLYDRVGGVFSERPKNYFSQTPDLATAVSFTIAQGRVYVLRTDGRLMTCDRDANTLQTSCIENTEYVDARPGRANGDRLGDMVAPASLFYDPPPEPSLYVLDQGLGGVYQLSLQVVLQRVQKPEAAFAGPINAVAIGPNKEVFAAVGNVVYWARRP